MRDEAVHAVIMAEQQRLEPERMAAEAKYVRALDWRRRDTYLRDVAKQRGAEAGEALRAAVREGAG